MPVKVNDLIIEVNSKYPFTDRNEYQFYKTLLKNFNSNKVGEEKSDVIWQYIHQIKSMLFINVGKR
jgi:hypothetical protein